MAFDVVTTSPTPEGHAHWLTLHNYHVLLQRGPPIQRKISRAIGIHIASIAPYAPGRPEEVTVSYILRRINEYDDILSDGFEIVAKASEAAP